jgi:hypothetical protein
MVAPDVEIWLYLLERGRNLDLKTPVLEAAYVHLSVYQRGLGDWWSTKCWRCSGLKVRISGLVASLWASHPWPGEMSS